MMADEKNPLRRFLLADDHAIVRGGVRQVLSAMFPEAEFVEVETAGAALQKAREQKLDLILLDVTMPGRSGLDALAELKEAQPRTPILVLSMHGEEQFAMRAFRAGASGYITKSSMPNELLKAVDRVLAGGRYVSETMAEHFAAVFQAAHEPKSAGSQEALSAREFEVLRMIAAGKSGKDIAADLSLSFKTVSTYRTRLLLKLDLRTNADLVKYALREGLIEGLGT
jgi:DNA-binding NarL/FixJ family response regulator